MTLPTPEEGLVIRYSYLWHAEYREGRQEGVKLPIATVEAQANHPPSGVQYLRYSSTRPSAMTMAWSR